MEGHRAAPAVSTGGFRKSLTGHGTGRANLETLAELLAEHPGYGRDAG
jgi:hypothetical protein